MRPNLPPGATTVLCASTPARGFSAPTRREGAAALLFSHFYGLEFPKVRGILVKWLLLRFEAMRDGGWSRV